MVESTFQRQKNPAGTTSCVPLPLSLSPALHQDHAEGVGAPHRQRPGPLPLWRAAGLLGRAARLGSSAPRQEGGGVLLDPHGAGVGRWWRGGLKMCSHQRSNTQVVVLMYWILFDIKARDMHNHFPKKPKNSARCDPNPTCL